MAAAPHSGTARERGSIMEVLRKFAAGVDACSDRLGRGLAYIVWLTAAVCVLVVGLRYLLHETFAWMQDLYVWLHAAVFLFGIVFAMRRDAHVRVDVFYAKWTPARRAKMECLGVLACALPWMTVLGWHTWPFVESSWAIREGSPQPNGLPGVFLLKSALLVFCILVAVQALALLAKAVLVIGGDERAAGEPPFGRASND
jgi:TRAP-type mannitol/chloroaromatic compound transport system permease small subunit